MSTQVKALLSIGVVVGAFFAYRSIGERSTPGRAVLEEAEVGALAMAELFTEDESASPILPADAERVAATVPAAAPGPELAAVARVVSGRVIDLDGRAVADVEVFAGKDVFVSGGGHDRSPRRASVMSRGDREVFARALTGSDGCFELSTSETRGTAAVEDERYTTVVASSFVGDDGELLIVVAWRLPLAGVVVDEKGAPVADAQLAVRRPVAALNELGIKLDHASLVDMTALSAADGSFEFWNAAEIPDGSLVVTAAGYELWIGALPAAGDEHLRVVLAPEQSDGKLLTGRVLEPRGDPAVGALVSCGGISVETNERGRFSMDPDHPAFDLLPQDTPLVLRAFLEGFAPASFDLATPSEGKQAGWPTPTLVLGDVNSLLAIEGQVVDQDGKPVADAKVHLLDRTPFGQTPRGPSREYFISTTVESLTRGGSSAVRTDAGGAFRIDGLLDKPYRLEAVDGESMVAVRTEPIEAGTSGLLIQLDRSRVGVVAGRLVDRHGEGVADVSISISRSVEGMGFEFGVRGVSAADGSFRLEGTTTEGITLSLNGETIVPEIQRELPEGADPENLELVVGRRCHVQFEWARWKDEGLTLRILDPDDQPLELIQIREHMWSVTPQAFVTGEVSDVFVLPDSAAHAVLMHDEEEVERVPLSLSAGKVQRIEL